MGNAELRSGEIDNLPVIQILGVNAKLIEIVGNFTNMAGENRKNSMMLGTICQLPMNTIFIKMTGPEAKIQNERGNFLKFCNSMKML